MKQEKEIMQRISVLSAGKSRPGRVSYKKWFAAFILTFFGGSGGGDAAGGICGPFFPIS